MLAVGSEKCLNKRAFFAEKNCLHACIQIRNFSNKDSQAFHQAVQLHRTSGLVYSDNANHSVSAIDNSVVSLEMCLLKKDGRVVVR